MNQPALPSWRSRYRQTSARFYLTLFLAMLVNGVVFRHGHRLADGRIISHAHPFRSNGKGPILPNSHTSLELLLLDAVSNPVLDMPSFEMPEFGLVELFTIPERPVSYESLLLARSFCFSFLRGPPALS